MAEAKNDTKKEPTHGERIEALEKRFERLEELLREGDMNAVAAEFTK